MIVNASLEISFKEGKIYLSMLFLLSSTKITVYSEVSLEFKYS